MFCVVFVLLICCVVPSLTCHSVCVIEGIGFGFGRLHSRAVVGSTAAFFFCFWCVVYCIRRFFSMGRVGPVHI